MPLPRVDFTTFHTSDKLFLKRGVVGVSLATAIRLRGIVSMVLLTRLWSPSEVGFYNMILLMVSLAYPIVSMNLHYGLRIHSAHLTNKQEIGERYWTFLGCTVIGIAAGVAALLLAWDHLPQEYTSTLHDPVLLSCILFIFVFNKAVLILPQMYQRLRISTTLLLATEYGSLLALVIPSWFGCSVETALYLFFISYLAIDIIALAFISADLGRPGLPRLGFVYDYIKLSLPTVPWKFFSIILLYVDMYYLGKYHGLDTVGVYSVAVRLATLVMGMEMFFTLSYDSAVTRFWTEQNRLEFEKYVGKTLRWMRLVLCANAALFAVFARPIVQILAGPEFHEAADILPVYAVAMSLALERLVLQNTLFAVRRPWSALICTTAAAAAGLALYVAWIPDYGMHGAAWATVIGFAVDVLAAYIAATLHGDFSLSLSSFGRAALCAAPLLALRPLLELLQFPAPLEILFAFPALAVFAAMAWRFRLLTDDEKGHAVWLLRNVLQRKNSA